MKNKKITKLSIEMERSKRWNWFIDRYYIEIYNEVVDELKERNKGLSWWRRVFITNKDREWLEERVDNKLDLLWKELEEKE